jgi:hypothetical protein
MKLVLSSRASFSVTRRAMMSGPVPGGYGTTTRTGRLGQSAVWARATPKGSANERPTRAAKACRSTADIHALQLGVESLCRSSQDRALRFSLMHSLCQNTGFLTTTY